MLKSTRRSLNLIRAFGLIFRIRVKQVMLPLALVLLAVNLFFSIFMVGNRVSVDSQHVTRELDRITKEAQPTIQSWLDTTSDSLYIQELWVNNIPSSWGEDGVSVLMFRDSVLVYWSNDIYSANINDLWLIPCNTIREIDEQQVITQQYHRGKYSAVVIVNLYNNVTDSYNENIFSDQRINLLPRSDSTLALKLNAVSISVADKQFYIEAKLMRGIPWWSELCGWAAIILLCLYLKNRILRHTNKYNVIQNAGILLLSLFLIRLMLYYTGIPNANGVLFDEIFGQYNIIAISLGDLIISYGIVFVYVAFVFQVRVKLKWRYVRLSTPLRVLTIGFYSGLIAFVISIFHYVMIMSIHESQINIQIYDIFNLTYSTAAFYTVAILLISILLIVARILFLLSGTHYLWIRVCFISGLLVLFLMSFGFRNQYSDYILVVFVAVAAIADYVRTRYGHYGFFVISLIVFSAYISTVATLENRIAQVNNQVLYARILATSTQDRNIINREEPTTNRVNLNTRFKDFTYARVVKNQIYFQYDNSNDYHNLDNQSFDSDTTIYHDGISYFIYNYGSDDEKEILVVSCRETTMLNVISLYVYTYIILFILCGLLLEMVGYNFNVRRIGSGMTLKIRVVVIGVVIGTMVAVTAVIVGHTLNNFSSEKRQFINNNIQRLRQSLDQFLLQNTFNESTVNRWLSHEIGNASYSINVFDTMGNVIARSSTDDTNVARMNSFAYRCLHYFGHPLYVSDINTSRSTSSYIPIVKQGGLRGYLNLKYHNSSTSNSNSQYALLSDIINLFLIVLFVAVLLSGILYRILVKPFDKLREAMRNISKMQKIDAVGSSRKISDEVGLLVEQYNLMIDSLLESYRQLARSEREGAWREMAQQVAHEIKNPLTPMRLKIQMLQRSMKEEECEELRPKVESTMNLLLDQIELLTKITSEFSDFARISEGNITRVNIVPIICNVTQLYSDFGDVNTRFYFTQDNQMNRYVAWYEAKSAVSISAMVDQDSVPIWVNADVDNLTRAFVNIFQNAVQSMTSKKGSCLDIALRLTHDRVFVSFCDNGVGISDELYDKIFMPKFTTKHDGNGLGLPVSQKIVEAIGGRISFESRVGVGTVFIVELPLCTEG